MKISLSVALFALFLAAGYCADPDPEVPTTETTITTAESTSTLTPTSTDPTTQSTTPSTTPDPKTTTPAPKTTTPDPKTTSTTPGPKTTSTVAPTTQAPITTTKSPAPPEPEIGSWNVTGLNGTCIMADLKLRFKIPIQGHDDYILLSPSSTSTGDCDSVNGSQTLILQDSEYSLTLTFDKDTSDAYLKSVEFKYRLPEGFGTVGNETRLFGVKLGNSYLCSSLEDVPLNNVTMEVFHIHVQAYGKEGTTSFGAAEECEADNKTADIVPIAVGCALLALVVVVLIAYFVGRRRSRQKGYQSV